MTIQRTIIERIGRLHGEVLTHARAALGAAVQIGGLLREIRDALDEDDWGEFVGALPFDERTARRYEGAWERAEDGVVIEDASDAFDLLSDRAAQAQDDAPDLPDEPEAPDLPDEPPSAPAVSGPPAEPSPASPATPASAPAPAPAPGPARAARSAPTMDAQTGRVVDEVGREIRAEHLPLWARRSEMSERVRDLAGVRSALMRAQEDGDMLWVGVNVSAASARLDQVIAEVRSHIPWTVCPQCCGLKANKCTLCKGRAFVSRWTFERVVPEEMREMWVGHGKGKRNETQTVSD